MNKTSGTQCKLLPSSVDVDGYKNETESPKRKARQTGTVTMAEKRRQFFDQKMRSTGGFSDSQMGGMMSSGTLPSSRTAMTPAPDLAHSGATSIQAVNSPFQTRQSLASVYSAESTANYRGKLVALAHVIEEIKKEFQPKYQLDTLKHEKEIMVEVLEQKTKEGEVHMNLKLDHLKEEMQKHYQY